MPAKVVDSSKPTFYLDQSTLSDAYRSVFLNGGASQPEYRALIPWLECVASEANLCISDTHVAELASWVGLEGEAMADWLDGLPLVWVHFGHNVMDSEDEYWVKMAAGATPSGTPSVFAPSMGSIYRTMNPVQSAQFLAAPKLRDLVALRRQAGTEFERAFSDRMVRALYRDRAEAAGDVAKESLGRLEVARKERAELRERIRTAHKRLCQGDAPDYPVRSTDVDTVEAAALALYDTNPRSFQANRALRAAIMGLGDVLPQKTPGSKSFSALGSFHWDLAHLVVGAAYCDVFTCDKETSRALGSFRASLGLKPQLCIGEFPSTRDFVAALTSTGHQLLPAIVS